jgi:Cd2+/Zn2+-exporting ATPase
MGILIKGGRHLESLASLQAIAFDKTGTLSEGRLQVAHSISKNSLSQNEMMKIIFVLESRSEHHFADAIKRYAKENNVQQNDYTLDEYKTIPGKGIKGKINNAMYYFGNLSLINEIGCKINSFENEIRKYEQSGETVSFFCSEKEIIGIVTFSDSVKNNAKEVIASLKNLGVKRTIILSGDSEFAVKRFADNLHIDEHRFSLLPDNKIKAIRALKAQYSTVAMVGDGINDAPALASATVGIAMGTNGTDTAIDAADVVLMSDNLKKIVDAITLSKRTNRILKQNIIISLGLKLIIFVMGIFGFATLWMAILADDGATLLVIANALRLLKSKND